MSIRGSPRRRAFAYGALAAVGSALILGATIVLAGAYNVSASAPHFYVSEWLLELALWRSVDSHSAGIDVPDLDDAGLARLGAKHFVTGCQPCHGGPGLVPGPIPAGMYPAAPPLGANVRGWEDKELFWIVRHGLKFTGMPQWTGDGRDDEVWSLVAFIRQLPDMSAERYTELTGAAGVAAFGFSGERAPAAAGCGECHGDTDEPPVTGLAPALQGQNGAYLLRALDEYASGARQSGMMEPLAAALAPEARRRLATEFAAMPPPASGDPARLDPDLVAAGEHLATKGLPGQNVPACRGCHSAQRSPQFPRLDGLSALYIANQIDLFRKRVRGGTSYGSIMAPIAGRLTKAQTEAVAAYFASLRPEASVAVADDKGGGAQ
jgi:cytochrome c553